MWQKGATLSASDGAGHVAVVEKVNADGSIVTSESGWNCTNPFWTCNYKAPYSYSDGYKLLGFVYQPETDTAEPKKDEPEKTEPKQTVPSGIIKKGDNGDSVKWLQTKLCEKGYLRKNEIDGDFGKITLGALLAFQLENGLLGVCGDETKAKL